MKNSVFIFSAFIFFSYGNIGASKKSLPHQLAKYCKKEYRVAEFVNNVHKFGPLDSIISKIKCAPNHPLKEVSRSDVFIVDEKRQAQKAYSVVQVEDKKFNYKATFLAVTLRPVICTKLDCSQATVGILSDINTLKPAAPITDWKAQKEEDGCGRINPRKYESIDVDLPDNTSGVISACNDCQKIELIFKKK